MNYSQRIAKVLSRLRSRLSLENYLKLTKRLGSVSAFEDLDKADQELIIKVEGTRI